jgi:hypothetical protein
MTRNYRYLHKDLRMPCDQNRLLLDRRKFLTGGSMALAAMASSRSPKRTIGLAPLTQLRFGTSSTTSILKDLRIPRAHSLIGTDADRKKTALRISEMWTTFARTGHPGAKGQPSWPVYALQKRATMMIDAQCRIEEDPFREKRTLWESLNS